MTQKNRKKKLCFIYLVYILIFCIYSPCQADIVDRIVAVVNEDVISLFELNQTAAPFLEKVQLADYPPEKEEEMIQQIRQKILNQLVEQRLTDQESKRIGISVGKKEVNAAIERVKSANFYTDDEFEKALEADGLSLKDYKYQIKEQILRSKLLDVEVRSKIIITEEDVKKYYETHEDEFRGEKRLHLRNILLELPPFPTEMEQKKLKEKINRILKKLKAGASFSDMARKHSDSSLAKEGGDLGVFAFTDLSPQLQSAVSDLQPKEITSVIETEQGYQLFFIEDIINVPAKTMEDAKPDIQEKLFKKIVNEKFRTWMNELRGRSHIKIFQ